MANPTQLLTDQEHKAMLNVCILAALADGAQDEVERTQIERIVNVFFRGTPGHCFGLSEVQAGKVSLPQVAAHIKDPSAKALAYEMAVCVCHSDGVLKDPERQFLNQLRETLQIDSASSNTHQQTAQALVEQPLAASAPPIISTGQDAVINRAGALISTR
jgi:uncharacterized membrane protein YebE (DUF533 family)